MRVFVADESLISNRVKPLKVLRGVNIDRSARKWHHGSLVTMPLDYLARPFCPTKRKQLREERASEQRRNADLASIIGRDDCLSTSLKCVNEGVEDPG